MICTPCRGIGWAVLAATMAAAPGAQAHHSFAAEYDATKPVSLKNAVVTKLEWTNPHTWVYVDFKNAAGEMEHWQCEGGAPNRLMREGWTKDTLKPGDVVTIDGFKAKNGANWCNSQTITLPDGRRVFSGSSGNGAPPPPQPRSGQDKPAEEKK
jgi:hypothetical protein